MSRHKILSWWPIVLSHPKHDPRPVVCVTKARFSEQVHPFHGVSLSDKSRSSLQLLPSAVAMWSVGSPTNVFLCRSPIVPCFPKHFFTEGLQEQRPSAGGVSEFIAMVQTTEAVHRQDHMDVLIHSMGWVIQVPVGGKTMMLTVVKMIDLRSGVWAGIQTSTCMSPSSFLLTTR